MRVALVADIHGNLVGLDAALAQIERDRPDLLICLGDVAEYGPQPRAVLARLRELACAVVMGNTDERLLDPKRLAALEDNRADDIERWVIEQLSAEDRAQIALFKPTVEVQLGPDLALLCCHGSPRSNREGIFADASDAALAAIVADVAPAIIANGHTHYPLVRRVGTKLLLNPGSVGLPIERNPKRRHPAWAEFALISYHDGALSLDLRRAPIDLEELRRVTLASGMPHAKRWLKEWR